MTKFLLCRPLGGLNDCLCQIAYAKKVAKIHRRKLLIQTETGSPNLHHRFGQKFEEIFRFDQTAVNYDLESALIELKSNPTVYPKMLFENVGCLDRSLEQISMGKTLNFKLSIFRFLKEDIVIHENWGGGLSSAGILGEIELVPEVYAKFKKILANIPKDGVAVHFRHTDQGSTYTALEKVIENCNIDTSILLATDDPSVAQRLQNRFPKSKINLAAEYFPENMAFTSPAERAILELLLISHCKDLVVLPLEIKSRDTPSFSGFARLAKHIWAVRKISQDGIYKFCLSRSPILGLAGSKNSFFNFFYLLIFEIPRILIQAKISKGIYSQILLR